MLSLIILLLTVVFAFPNPFPVPVPLKPKKLFTGGLTVEGVLLLDAVVCPPLLAVEQGLKTLTGDDMMLGDKVKAL